LDESSNEMEQKTMRGSRNIDDSSKLFSGEHDWTTLEEILKKNR
jgi:hypothetical protein